MESAKIEYPEVLDLDGVYRRVQRNGKWESVCFSDLTEAEQDEFLLSLDTAATQRLCRLLAAALRTCATGAKEGNTGDV